MASKSKLKNHRDKGYTGGFLMLRFDIIHSEAWLALKSSERSIFIQIWQRINHNGENNGFIAVSHEQLSKECHLKRDTVSKAIKRLEEIGFLECVCKGSFDFKKRHASEYRLTFYKCFATGKLPSNDWRHFQI